MGVRIEVQDGEPIGKACRRLRKHMQLQRCPTNGLGFRTWRMTEPSEHRRWKEWRAKVAAKRAARKRRRELGLLSPT